MPPRLVLLLVASFALTGVAASCTSTNPATITGGTPATFQAVQTQVFTNCTTSSCHSAVGARGDLVLDADLAYDQLVGVPASNSVAKGKGKLRVKPNDPDGSFLLQKLEAPSADEGALMPSRGAKLTAAQIDLVRRWIAAGAPK